MNAAQVNLNPSPEPEAGVLPPGPALSALVDGELEAAQVEGLLATGGPEGAALLADWHSFLVIGEVLRGATAVTAARPAADFLAGVRDRLQSESRPQAIPKAGGLAPAADDRMAHVRAPAANDSLFRWKLVAGFASLAAVSAVSWGVLSGSPSASSVAAPQLAVVAPTVAAPVVGAAGTLPAPSTAVAVDTGQGTLIRDARLEALLAEHRQNAGMSALQMPTGFIRDATYDTTGR